MHVAVIFGALGPYHLARMNAVQNTVRLSSWSVTTIERVGYQDEYTFFQGDIAESLSLRRAYSSGNPSPTDKDSAMQLRKLLTELKPDCVAFGRSSPVYYVVLVWCLKNHVPTVLLSDSTVYDFKRYAWKEWIKSRVVKLFSAGFVAGKRHEDYMQSLGMPKERIVSRYDVVDNDHFSKGLDAVRSDAESFRKQFQLPKKYFLASCRFVEKKNLLRLIEAYVSYVKYAGDPAWSFVLLGDGELRPVIEKKIKELGITHKILIQGFKDYESLPVYYGLASAFILASTSEQWGLVVNEAMAAGLPVLVSDRCGCAPDLVVNGQNGFTFDPFNVQALADLMGKMSAEDTDRVSMGQSSRDIIKRWTPETFAINLKKAVECALQAPPPKFALFDKVLLWGLAPK